MKMQYKNKKSVHHYFANLHIDMKMTCELSSEEDHCFIQILPSCISSSFNILKICVRQTYRARAASREDHVSNVRGNDFRHVSDLKIPLNLNCFYYCIFVR